MYTIDANIFIRDLDNREPNHNECHALLIHLITHQISIIVPTLVLAEISGTVSRTRRNAIAGRLAAEALHDIPHLTFVSLDESVAREATAIAADRAIRGADAIYVAVAQRYRATLITLDRELTDRAAPIVTIMQPQQVLATLS
ncbi:type II toxin-antitoxin system VapC family toxin [Candidatus Viridilinea mediisalina]|uniref:Ribonuclease VapC n=1 Tax=Candidatus Viridilinea mediisalina TaxID=2024553 RepID=A0A2A6RDC4_9CHLR|nr:type II toxin-antitoxin system VapC family toxin [Candidatus Viridilinea mediisalina]PDV98019.1 VapC toxin family PIN domain ribonuclease [Candidatus Viridilinea mediisalina]